MSAASLRSEWAACLAIARDAVLAHPSKGGITLSRGLVGFGVLMSVIAMMVSSEDAFKACMAVAGISFSFFVILWWVLLIASVARQNLGLMRLVPGIGRRSVRVLLACWLAGTACASLPFALAGVPAPQAIGVAALALALIAMAMARPIIYWLLLAMAQVPPLIDSLLVPLNADMVLAIRIAFGLWIVIVAGRALQGRQSASIVRQAILLKAGLRSADLAGTAYARQLEHDCNSGDAGALLLHCLGAEMRLTTSLRAAAPFLLVPALLIAGPAMIATYRATPPLHFIMPALAVTLQWMLAQSMARALRDTAAEQALVMLTPRRPPASAIQALLSRAVKLRYGLAWLLSTLALLGLSALIGDGAVILTWMLAACLGTLAAATLKLRAAQAFPASRYA